MIWLIYAVTRSRVTHSYYHKRDLRTGVVSVKLIYLNRSSVHLHIKVQLILSTTSLGCSHSGSIAHYLMDLIDEDSA